MANAYVNSKKSGKKKQTAPNSLAARIMRQPGSVYGIYNYLQDSGRHLVPRIVEKELGDHWYTGIAESLSKTSLGRNYVLNKLLDKMLPSVGGDNSLANQFLQAGGQV